QSAAQGFLPAHAVGGHPITQFLGVLNRQASETFVGLASSHLLKIFPELLLLVCTSNIVGGSPVHVANVAGVTAGAAAKIFRGTFEHQNPRGGAPRGYRSTKSRVTATYHQHVKRLSQHCH